MELVLALSGLLSKVSVYRSDTPLIYKAVPSWFIRVEHAQHKLLENNKKTYWLDLVTLMYY